MVVVIGSYRTVEHLGGAGSGHRSSPFWRAQDTRTGEDVAVAMLPVEVAAAARETADVVGAVRHPHLLPVSDVVEDQTRLALVTPWPRGGRLTELVRRRGALSPAETVTVLLPLAAALTALHADGVRHGGVCPEAIWFDARGRPLLGAAAVSTVVAEVAGQAVLGCADVAPEVLRQARTGPAGPAADVFSLGSVALFCLTGRSAWPAEEPADVLVQSAAGQWPDPPDDAGPADLIALVRAMLHADPAARPAADAVVRGLSGVGCPSPEPIRFGSGPVPTPASSKRWRGWSGPADDAREAEDDGADPPAAAEAVGPSAPGARRRRGPMARLAIALLSGLLLTVLVAQVGNWLGDPPESGPSVVAATDWARVVADLDEARSRALADADPALLGDVYVPGSAAAAADAAVIDGLDAKGWRVPGATHQIVDVQVLPDPGDGSTRVAVVDTLPAHPVVDGAGQQVATTPARGEQRRVLVLQATETGYRISDVEPG